MELYLNLINIFMWTVVGLCNVTGMLIVTNPQRTITHSGVSSIFQDTVLVAAFIREQNSSTSVVKHTNYKCSLSCGFLNNCLVKLLQHQSNLKAQTCSGLPFLSVIHPPALDLWLSLGICPTVWEPLLVGDVDLEVQPQSLTTIMLT